MYKYNIYGLLLAGTLFLAACGNTNSNEGNIENTKNPVVSGVSFTPVANTYDNYDLKVPDGAVVDVLFTEATDSVRWEDGSFKPARGKADFLAYIPIDGSSQHGYLFVNHELREDGGMSWFEVQQDTAGNWEVIGDFVDIPFEEFGNTWHNCGGAVTPHNTILTAEEYPPATNADLLKARGNPADTVDFGDLKAYEQLGWMVEVDIETKKVLRKLYGMGRYSHEDVHCMADGRTVYLTDDYSPGVFFKFVADAPGSYETGTLYAYQQSDDGESGIWLPLPNDMESLINIREVAIKAGATLFRSMEWAQAHNDILYLTESGGDSSSYEAAVAMGGRLSKHLRPQNGKIIDNPHGQVLRFDPSTNKLDVFIAGGPMADGGHFSKPDGLTSVTINGVDYLVICEDGDHRRGRVSPEAAAKGENYNEIYFLDLSIANPSRDDLIRFSVGPRGCEQTGPIFTPDGKTMFVSVQNPDKRNPEPYNRTTVVAITSVF